MARSNPRTPPPPQRAGALIERHWQAHAGTVCASVSWDAMPLPELLEVADCIGGVGLSVVFRVMAEDGAGSHGGWWGFGGVGGAHACVFLAARSDFSTRRHAQAACQT